MVMVRATKARMQNPYGPGPAAGARGVRRCIYWLAWVAGLLLFPCVGLGQPSYDLGAAAKDLAGQLTQHFPPLKGEVLKVQGDELYLSVGSRDQVAENMQLDVFREGDELISPSTGEVLGRLEEDLGTVTITHVAETYAVAIHTDAAGRPSVQAGDRIRITAGKLSLALLPESAPNTGRAPTFDALSDALLRSLDATGRFDVVPGARLTLWLLQRGLSPGDMLPPEVMAEAAGTLGVDYLVQAALREAGERPIAELQLLAPTRPHPPVTTALAVLREAKPAVQGPAAQATVGVPPVRPESLQRVSDETLPGQTKGPTALQTLLGVDSLSLEERYLPIGEFPTELRGFDAADIDGDGRTEIVMLSAAEVSLYRLTESRLVPVASYSDRRFGTMLSAQLLRPMESQVPFVVVNRYSSRRGGMDSLLLVLRDDQLIRHQKGLSDIMIAVDADGDGVNETLWGQRFDGDDFFRRGQVRQYEWRNGRLQRQQKVTLPVRFRATGTALAQLGPQRDRQLVFVDERHSLYVYDGDTRRWASRVDVGGSYVSATLQNFRGGGNYEQLQFDFEAIPAVADLDGDGIDEVLIPQNHGSLGMVPNLDLYSGGHVVLMRQTPQGFALSPVSPGFDGVVSGVTVLKGREAGILVAVSKREGMRRKEKTILYLNRF